MNLREQFNSKFTIEGKGNKLACAESAKECWNWINDNYTSKATNGWRSVKDELPKDGKQYLTFGCSDEPEILLLTGGKWIDPCDMFENLTGVTHWKSLPAKPDL